MWRAFERGMRSPWAPLLLFTYSFVETVFTLIPIDPFAIAVMVADRTHTYSIAIYIVLGSLLGASMGYWLGHTALDSWGPTLLGSESAIRTFTHIKEIYLKHEFLITFTTAFVPIPKTPTIIAAGFLSGNIFVYIVAWALGRTLHFFAEAVIVRFSFNASLSYGMRALTVGSFLFAVVVAAYIALQYSGIL